MWPLFLHSYSIAHLLLALSPVNTVVSLYEIRGRNTHLIPNINNNNVFRLCNDSKWLAEKTMDIYLSYVQAILELSSNLPNWIASSRIQKGAAWAALCSLSYLHTNSPTATM